MNNSLVVSSPTLIPKKEPVGESTTTSKTDSVVSKVVHNFLPLMTIRRKQVKENGEIEVVEQEVKNPWLRLLLDRNGPLYVIIIIVITAHPLGRSFLAGLGFEFQDTKKIEVAATEAKATKVEVTSISDALKELSRDVTALKSNNAILQTKVDAIGEKQSADRKSVV